MEKLTFRAGLLFLSEAFEFIMAEKYNILVTFYNLTRTFAYAMK